MAGIPVRILLILGFAVILSMFSGFDRLTTVTWMSLVGGSCALGMGALIGLLVGRDIFLSNESIPLTRLREVSPMLWAGVGAAYIGLFFVSGSYLTGKLVGAIGQHLPGDESRVHGKVVTVSSSDAARTACLRKVAVAADTGETLKFCIHARRARPIAPAMLQTGDDVVLVVRRTSLGESIIAVE